jgi:hypothetical protein
MARHNTPGIQLKTFVFHAIFKAIDNNITVYPPHKNIYPVYRCKAYKVKLVVLVKNIFAAHFNQNTILIVNIALASRMLATFRSKLKNFDQ